MKTRFLIALVVFIFVGTFLFAGEQISISTVYDNYAVNQSLSTDWGFGCVLKMPNIDILFDTGTNGSMLLTNMEIMNINPKDIDMVVISHKHMDHGGGLDNFLEQNANVKVYIPTSCSVMKIIAGRQGAECQEVRDFSEIANNVYSTGEMEYKAWALTEQSLVIDTEKGLVVITGCAHPGIVDILKRAKQMLPNKEIYLVMGGFHLKDLTESESENVIKAFKKLGVKKIAPSHCSGDTFREVAKQKYKKNYIEGGVGHVISF